MTFFSVFTPTPYGVISHCKRLSFPSPTNTARAIVHAFKRQDAETFASRMNAERLFKEEKYASQTTSRWR